MRYDTLKRFIILTLFIAPGLLSLPASGAFYFLFGAEMIDHSTLGTQAGLFVVLAAFSIALIVGYKLWFRTVKLALGKLSKAQETKLWGDQSRFNVILCFGCVASFALLRLMLPSGGRGNIDQESVVAMTVMVIGQCVLAATAKFMERRMTGESAGEDHRVEVFQ